MRTILLATVLCFGVTGCVSALWTQQGTDYSKCPPREEIRYPYYQWCLEARPKWYAQNAEWALRLNEFFHFLPAAGGGPYVTIMNGPYYGPQQQQQQAAPQK